MGSGRRPGGAPITICITPAAFPAELVRQAAATWPAPDWSGWVCYDSPLERKRAGNDWRTMPPACRDLLGQMLALPVPNGIPDALLWGAGLHEMAAGDHLDVHLDSDRHPLTGLERRANAILFLEDWHPGWGGELQFWGPDLRCPVAAVTPAAGTLVQFDTGDQSYHGVARLTCHPGIRRKSLAVYWWGLPRGESHRPRAAFVAVAGEPADPARDALRAARAV